VSEFITTTSNWLRPRYHRCLLGKEPMIWHPRVLRVEVALYAELRPSRNSCSRYALASMD